MTMPSVIADYQKKVISAQLKKFVSTINQAIDLAKAENGDYEYWNVAQKSNTKNSQIFRDYLVPKLKINLSACENIDFDSHYANTRTTSFYFKAKKENCIGVLNDSAIIFDIADIYEENFIYTAFMVDVNGIKPPNRGAKDMFAFAVWLKADCDDRSCDMVVGQYHGITKGETGLIISGKYPPIMNGTRYNHCLKAALPSYCGIVLRDNSWQFPVSHSKDYIT